MTSKKFKKIAKAVWIFLIALVAISMVLALVVPGAF